MSKLALKFPRTASIGNTVSHAKNRHSRAFKYNLQTVTVVEDGKKMRLRVPAKLLKTLKKAGVTTHHQKAD
ncbi:50S ribosomal protein L28 [Microgenomates group bacterium]|nr:50S ribosomal protein L28 [Microgenomates group bacterium]